MSERELWSRVLAYVRRQLGCNDWITDPEVVERLVAIAKRPAHLPAEALWATSAGCNALAYASGSRGGPSFARLGHVLVVLHAEVVGEGGVSFDDLVGDETLYGGVYLVGQFSAVGDFERCE